MKTPLKNLIRIHDWEVDEKRRRLGDLLRVQDDLRQQRQRLIDDLKREQELAYGNPESATFYGAYAEAVIDRRNRLDQSIHKMDFEIAAARDEVRQAFRELKKYEVAQEQREEAEAQEANRKEQGDLDEIGLMRSVRARGG